MSGAIYLRCSRLAGMRIPGFRLIVLSLSGRMIPCSMLWRFIAFGKWSRKVFFVCLAYGWIWLFACGAVWLFAYGVGLSLYSYRSISFAPVRGGTYFLCRRKESRQRKWASN